MGVVVGLIVGGSLGSVGDSLLDGSASEVDGSGFSALMRRRYWRRATF